MAEKYGWRKSNQQSNNQQVNGQQNTEKTYGWRKDSSADVSTTVGTNITNRVNTWLKNHDTYISNYQTRNAGRKYDYSDSYVRDSADWLTKVSQQKSAFDAEADSILAYMDQYKGYLDADWMKSVRDTLTSARGQQSIVLENSTKDNEWWSSFGTEEMVNAYGSAEKAYQASQRYDGYSKKYSGYKYDDIQKAFAMLEDGEEKNWLATNQYDLYKNDTKYNSKAMSGMKSYEAQMIAEQEAKREEEASKTGWEKFADFMISNPAYDNPMMDSIMDARKFYAEDTSYREPNEKWDEGQRRQFGYLFAESPDKAYAYAEQVNNQINAKQKYEQQQAIGNWSSQNVGTGTLGTLGAIATAPMGVGDLMDDPIEYSARGTITQKAALSPFEMGQAAQSGITNKLNAVDENGVAQNVLPDWGPVFG